MCLTAATWLLLIGCFEGFARPDFLRHSVELVHSQPGIVLTVLCCHILSHNLSYSMHPSTQMFLQKLLFFRLDFLFCLSRKATKFIEFYCANRVLYTSKQVEVQLTGVLFFIHFVRFCRSIQRWRQWEARGRTAPQ